MMTDKDIIFKFYQQGETPNPDCFCHYGWEGTGSFAFWKFAQAYYDSAEILYEKFTHSKGDFAVLDGIGLTICFLYRHYVELTVKYLYVKYEHDESQYKQFFEIGHQLNKLWIKVRVIIKPLKERVGSKVNLNSLDHYIREIDKFDQNEVAMRYPIKNNMKPMHESTRLDIYNLHDRMTELYNAFKQLDDIIENQLFDEIPHDLITTFLEKYEALRPRVMWFLESLRRIDLIEDKGPIWLSLGAINQENTKWAKQIDLFKSCTNDELILLDTLYYTGLYIRTGQLNLPKYPKEAKIDAVKQCIINMRHDHIIFGQPQNVELSIEMKSISAILRCIPFALAAIDFDKPEVIERLKQVCLLG